MLFQSLTASSIVYDVSVRQKVNVPGDGYHGDGEFIYLLTVYKQIHCLSRILGCIVIRACFTSYDNAVPVSIIFIIHEVLQNVFNIILFLFFQSPGFISHVNYHLRAVYPHF